MMMEALARFLRSIKGIREKILSLPQRRALFLCLFLGALHLFAFAPFHAGILFAFTLPPLIWLLDKPSASRHKDAFLYGFAFGLGFFASSLYWVAYAFLLDPVFFFLAPVAPIALGFFLAFFPAIALLLSAFLWRRNAARFFILALCWTALEILRAHVLTGFPWNMVGQSWAASLPLMQSAAWVGTYGMTFLTILCAGALASLGEEGSLRAKMRPPLLALLLLALLYGGGLARLSQKLPPVAGAPLLLILQPNIAQAKKWDLAYRDEHVARVMAMSESALRGRVGAKGGKAAKRILIWPESTLPLLFERRRDLRLALSAWMGQGDWLLAGALRLEGEGDKRRAYNSLLVMDRKGDILERHDKLHLTPFGEYLPFQSFLEGLGFRQLTRIRGGFTASAARKILKMEGIPAAAPLICYEIIFPDEIPGTAERPRWLVNITNDGWFGVSPGPFQHLEQARLRAVENGTPVARAANTGVSAVIDAEGRLLASLSLNEEGVIESPLPQALAPTFYARYGGWIPFLIFAALIISLIAEARRRGKSA